MSEPLGNLRKVFISSTHDDLLSYRSAAKGAVDRFQWFAVAMEDFVAQDQRPLNLCLELLNSCAAYVGIFAHRYGHIPAGHEHSITELEYRHAVSKNIPCLVFIVDPEQPWRLRWVDDGDSKLKLDRLKAELTQTHECSFFTDETDLALKLAAALAGLTRDELTKQLIDYSSQLPLHGAPEVPQVNLKLFRRPPARTDVRCFVYNASAFPTTVRTFLTAEVNGRHFSAPVPGHYAGKDEWNVPAGQAYDGHFDWEEHILKKAGYSYDALLLDPRECFITIRWEAQDVRGDWHQLGTLRYIYDFDNENWLVLP